MISTNRDEGAIAAGRAARWRQWFVTIGSILLLATSSAWAADVGSSDPAPTAVETDCLFTWGESGYPEILSPAGASTLSWPPYLYRSYTKTNAYLAVSVADNHLYYFGPLSLDSLLDLGPVRDWLNQARCGLPTFSVYGTVTQNNTALAGVSVFLNGGGVNATVTTDASANYTFANIRAGTYTLTPTLSGYTFSPPSRSVVVSGANATVPAFSAAVGSSGGTNQIQTGTLELYNSAGVNLGSFTATTASVGFNVAGNGPYTVTITGKLASTSGIAKDTAFLAFASSDPGVTGLPAQCSAWTDSPTCSVSFAVASATARPVVTASVVGSITAGRPSDTWRKVTALVQAAAPSFGTIRLSTQSGETVPVGMKAPLFINLSHVSQARDVVTVRPTITYSGSAASSPVQFYWFNPGDNQNIQTGLLPPASSPWAPCTLDSQGNSSPSCGYGLIVRSDATVGDKVTIKATASGTAGHTYAIEDLTLTVVAQRPTVRKIAFTNSSSKDIWVGITGGGAAALTSPTASVVPPGRNAATIKAGAGSACALTNPAAACPTGSTCMQGGASPNKDPGKSPYYCYYDQNEPRSGGSAAYKIAANGGTTEFSISGSNLSPQGVYWSGNFFGRTNCDSPNGCDIGCNAKNDGGACGPATGATPGIATLAELTFLDGTSATDYYDVSIINGANLGVQFGPSNPSGPNKYDCGVAGSTSGPANFAQASASNLPKSTWSFSPTSDNFPPGSTLGAATPASYYHYVMPSAASKSSCTQTTDCRAAPGGVPGDVCGYSAKSINSGNTSDYALRCGAPVAWVTANSIWGFNQDMSGNKAPFGFNVGDATNDANWTPTGLTGAGAIVGNYQLCNGETYSNYQPPGSRPPILACGGVMWGDTPTKLPSGAPLGTTGLGITYPNPDVANNSSSANWMKFVLPTIQWLKQACPTCYTYPYDDASSTFTCKDLGQPLNYTVTFGDASMN